MKSFESARRRLGLCLLCALATAGLHGEERRTAPAELQQLVDSMRDRLAIAAPVVVAIVPENALLVSVVPSSPRLDTFVLSFEAAFLSTLDDDDLRAVIAHELGHVWIFTHHPYLQTERQANDIAMRVVSRDSLQRVYAKVWRRGGAKGDLERFLGQE